LSSFFKDARSIVWVVPVTAFGSVVGCRLLVVSCFIKILLKAISFRLRKPAIIFLKNSFIPSERETAASCPSLARLVGRVTRNFFPTSEILFIFCSVSVAIRGAISSSKEKKELMAIKSAKGIVTAFLSILTFQIGST